MVGKVHTEHIYDAGSAIPYRDGDGSIDVQPLTFLAGSHGGTGPECILCHSSMRATRGSRCRSNSAVRIGHSCVARLTTINGEIAKRKANMVLDAVQSRGLPLPEQYDLGLTGCGLRQRQHRTSSGNGCKSVLR